MTVILVINLFALATGAAVIILAHRMDKECRLPPVRDYLVFVVLAVVSGFFDWIVFDLVRALVPKMPLSDIDAIYHIFWELIGFPCAMAAAAWLLFALAGFLDIRLDRKWRILLASPFLLLGLLSILRVITGAGDAGPHYSLVLWRTFTIALPLFHLILLAAAYARAWRFRDVRGTVVRQFVLLLFFGMFIWHALSLIPSRFHPSFQLSILWFYMALLPPTLLLRSRLGLFQCLEAPPDFSRESLAPVFGRYGLTDREKDVLLLLLDGKSYKVMKDELFLSLQTVKNYVSRIYGKLGVRNRVELVNLVRNFMRRA